MASARYGTVRWLQPPRPLLVTILYATSYLVPSIPLFNPPYCSGSEHTITSTQLFRLRTRSCKSLPGRRSSDSAHLSSPTRHQTRCAS